MSEILVFNANAEKYPFKRGSELASGFDLYACERAVIRPGKRKIIPTGIHVAMPAGVEAQIRPRSGRAKNDQVAVFGTIDADYRGDCSVNLKYDNDNDEDVLVRIEAGERIAQLVFAPVILPDLMVPVADEGSRARMWLRQFDERCWLESFHRDHFVSFIVYGVPDEAAFAIGTRVEALKGRTQRGDNGGLWGSIPWEVVAKAELFEPARLPWQAPTLRFVDKLEDLPSTARGGSGFGSTGSSGEKAK